MTEKNSMQYSNQSGLWLLLMIFFGVISRLIPHLPNMTPLISLSIIANIKLNRWYAMAAMVIILLVSDSLLSLLFKYPVLHHWSYFTYSGFLINTWLFSDQSRARFQGLFFSALAGTLLFWIWTNFGVWLTTALYTKTFHGFLLCYFAALPFLRNALIGSMIWITVYYFTLNPFSKKSSREFAG